MHVYLDTNVFFNQWYLDTAPLRFLFNYLNNEDHELLLSRLVLEEVENLRNRALGPAHKGLRQAAADWKRLTRQDLSIPDAATAQKYDLYELLRARVQKVRIIEYENLSHARIVRRAMEYMRPFRESEKGYRDTLIWLSLVEHLKKEKPDHPVALITENVSDFFGSDKQALHQHLAEDLNLCGLVDLVVPYKSLATFVQANVSPEEHLIDKELAIREFLRYVEDEFLGFVEDRDPRFVKLLAGHLFDDTSVLARASPMSGRIMEGVEDFELDSVSPLGKGDVYVTCTFDIRRLDLAMDLVLADYYQHVDAITASSEIYEVNVDEVVATIHALVRPVVRATFTYDPRHHVCDGFTIGGLGFRERASESFATALSRSEKTAAF